MGVALLKDILFLQKVSIHRSVLSLLEKGAEGGKGTEKVKTKRRRQSSQSNKSETDNQENNT